VELGSKWKIDGFKAASAIRPVCQLRTGHLGCTIQGLLPPDQDWFPHLSCCLCAKRLVKGKAP